MKKWTIGSRSGQQADLYLDDPTVSRQHASVTRTDDGRWLLEDRSSTNGTARFLNGRWVRVSKSYVQPDERLRFGRAETTVKDLLRHVGPGRVSPPPDKVIPWRHDMTFAFSRLRSYDEFKRNLAFVLELISSPARHTLHCAVFRQPVNPFSFMVFGGVMYTLITTFGLTLASALKLVEGWNGASLPRMVLGAMPKFLAFFVLTLIYNVIPFRIFRYFSAKKRHFDDFMRLMAVVNGLAWMLTSFVFLLLNECMQPSPDPSLVIATYFLSMITFIYLTGYGVLVQKHFWRIGYGLTLWAYFVSALATIAIVAALFAPAWLISQGTH